MTVKVDGILNGEGDRRKSFALRVIQQALLAKLQLVDLVYDSATCGNLVDNDRDDVSLDSVLFPVL